MTFETTNPLPPDFNPETFLRVQEVESGRYHESRKGARLAADLIAAGAPGDLALAEKVLDATLACQEINPADPHVGNFYWMAEDAHVEDLNAVEFVLESLIPMMLSYSDRLSPDMTARVKRAIRLGLDEIRRLDVLVAYTNITALDVLNTVLGGELLGDQVITERGYRKLIEWIVFTAESGHPLEYNSPTYTSVTLRALSELNRLSQNKETRTRARALAARLAVSAALHIHEGTGRWAAPHSRAYQPSVTGESAPERERVDAWIADGIVPDWVRDVLDRSYDRFQIVETASRDMELGFTTFQTPSYALGVASRAFHAQSDVCMLHYLRPDSARPGVCYSRYVIDDKWFGDFYHATDRSFQRNLLDEGAFWGVQDENRAIGVYAPRSLEEAAAAKLSIIWTDRASVSRIWMDGEEITQLPLEIGQDSTLAVESGSVLIAIRPLLRTALSADAPAVLCEREGDLVLDLYNYRGPRKRFWEMRWPGAFFQGKPVCAFYVEVVERDAFADGADFCRTVAAGSISEDLAPAFTYGREGERVYQVEYSRDQRTLGLSLDTMLWRLHNRWTHEGEVGFPHLESPMARQRPSGRVEAAEAVFTCSGAAPWLWGNPEAERWVAGHFDLQPADVTLATPVGLIEVRNMGMGTILWDRGDVTVDAVGAWEFI